MKTHSPTESQLDDELAASLLKDEAFAQWFLEQTKFKLEKARCLFCRSDNPWSRVESERINVESGQAETFRKDRETDVLVVYETANGKRLALHIENKLANGSFTPHQPESYRERLEQWRLRERLGMYAEATSVLIAPRTFQAKNSGGAQIFEAYVAHEEIGKYIPSFARSAASAA